MNKAVYPAILIFLTGALNLFSQSITSVSITGTPIVGSLLTGTYTAVPGTGNHFKFEWFTSPSNALLPSALVTYTVQPSDNGTQVYFKLSIIKDFDDSEVMSMSSSNVIINSFPVVTAPAITGTAHVGEVLLAGYSYFDPDGDPEGATKYQWYRTSTGAINDTVIIAGATNIFYKLTVADYNNKVAFAVLPYSSSGSNPGIRKSSVLTATVTDNPPVAGVPVISGTLQVGEVLTAAYSYNDAEGDPEGVSVYQWYRSLTGSIDDTTRILSATGISYKLTNADFGHKVAFAVIPYASAGDMMGLRVSTNLSGTIINNPPVATTGNITGSLNAGNTLIGHYLYTDAEGDAESSSSYQWYSSPVFGGTYGPIPGDTLLTHIVQISEQGKWFKFSVKPRTLSGSSPGILEQSAAFGPANSKPLATAVNITGTLVVGGTLTGHYTYSDADGDMIKKSATSFKWFRDGSEIPNAVDSTYLISEDDEGSVLKFQVIPVSATGFPDTGDPASSPQTAAVPLTAGLPVASQLCIDGKRDTSEVLTGKYHYSNTSSDDKFQFRWMRDNDTIPGKNGTTYTLLASDLDHEIYFVVYPFSHSKARKRGLEVKSASLARINLVKDTFYATDKDTLLTGIPSGGVFYGDGITNTNGIFSPSSRDYKLSPFVINYQINTGKPPKSCSQIHSKSIIVKGVTMYFESFEPYYCQNGKRDTIYVKNIPPLFVPSKFYMTGPNAIVSQKDSTVVIDPALMRAGNKLDTLYFEASFTFPPPFLFSIKIPIAQPFIVDEVPPVAIINLPDSSVLCDNVPEFKLFGTPAGGKFTGGMIKNMDVLDPSMGHRYDTVKYKISTPMGCVSSIIVPVTVNPSPVVSFHLADYCIDRDIADTTRFINTTLHTDPVNKWYWEFSEGGASSTSGLFEPGYLYKKGDLHNVVLTATTINNCVSRKDTTFNLGIKPRADFTWLKECFHPNDSILLKDNSDSPSLITSRSWNFFDGDSLHIVKDPKYPKKKVGYLPVQYIVKTNYANCHDTITKKIYIRNTISLLKDNYFQNFETGNGGWVRGYEDRNSWAFGKPDRPVINKAASGDSAWFTNYSLSNQKIESSSIVSPCFDFTSIQRPMISLKLWKRFDRNRDGAALQYMVGDSAWEYVGTLNDGINWYTSSLIKGKPGGEQVGWSEKEAKWVEARHKLDELKGAKDVKFRIAYGSDGNSQDNDGIAFDDIWIGSRTRGVLLEHFTNTSSVNGSNATALVDTLVKRGSEDIINIQYHSNFPGSDPFYNDNPGDVSARLLFYGLSRVPYSFIDGGTRKNPDNTPNFANIYDYIISDINGDDLIRRSLISPSFLITLVANVAGGTLTVSGQIKAIEADTAENYTLYIAVTEKKNTAHHGALGETEFINVFRKFLPDAGGINLKKIWAKNDSVPITDKPWIIEKIPNNSNIEIIAFIQNNLTKEIYQGQSILKPNISVGIDNVFSNSGKGFALYPNPAGKKLTIAFEKALESRTEIIIYDFKGTVLRTFKADQGQIELFVSELGLRNGIYLVKIRSGNLDWGYKKLIVTGN